MKRDQVQRYLEDGLERIRRHPFITGAHELTLTKNQGQRWIMCAGRESRSFVAILKNLASWCANENVREILLANLADELGKGDPQEAHYVHYLGLLDALCIPRSNFYSYSEKAGIKLALSLAYNISLSKRESCALGYLLINEAMTPITYGAAKTALRVYYPDLKTDFFDIHVVTDDLHVKKLYEAVDELSETLQQELFFGIHLGERGMAVLLDEAFGIFDNADEIPGIDQPVDNATP